MFYRKKGLAACGLACPVCREAECPGCAAKGCASAADCGILKCVGERGLAGCYECGDFPCGNGMFDSVRVRAFARYAKAFGVESLLDRLEANHAAGIVYHAADGLKGDYDDLPTEEAVIEMIRSGQAITSGDIE